MPRPLGILRRPAAIGLGLLLTAFVAWAAADWYRTVPDDALQHATTVRFAAGSPIMREGEAGVSMYVVMEGKVSITIRNSEVGLVQAGGTFGEMALVDQSPRTASATAQSDCILLSVNRSALLALVRSQPSIGIAMLRSVADRLRHMNGLLA